MTSKIEIVHRINEYFLYTGFVSFYLKALCQIYLPSHKSTTRKNIATDKKVVGAITDAIKEHFTNPVICCNACLALLSILNFCDKKIVPEIAQHNDLLSDVKDMYQEDSDIQEIIGKINFLLEPPRYFIQPAAYP